MPDPICRLTVAACTDDAHRAVDLSLPTDVHIGALVPQIFDIVHGDTAPSMSGREWRLSRLGDHPMDDSMTLSDNDVRDGEVLLLTTIEHPPAEWVECDPCHAMAADASATGGPNLRIAAVISCVLLGGCGAVALAWPAAGIATASRIVTGTCVAIAAAVAATVVRRRHDEPLMCVSLSLTAVLFAGAVGFVTVPPGPAASGVLLAASAAFAAAIILLPVTGCGRTCLMSMATLSALIATVAFADVMWQLEPTAGGAALTTLSLALLGFAPRLAMVISGTGPSGPRVDTERCRPTLTGLVMGAATAAALGTAMVATGLGLRDVTFAGVVAVVLLLRARTHVEPQRRISLAAAAMLTAAAGFAAVAVSAPTHAHVVSIFAATAGAAALGCLARPTVSPIVVRTVEVLDYVAIAAVVPAACWVAGVYESVRGMSLI